MQDVLFVCWFGLFFCQYFEQFFVSLYFPEFWITCSRLPQWIVFVFALITSA